MTEIEDLRRIGTSIEGGDASLIKQYVELLIAIHSAMVRTDRREQIAESLSQLALDASACGFVRVSAALLLGGHRVAARESLKGMLREESDVLKLFACAAFGINDVVLSSKAWPEDHDPNAKADSGFWGQALCTYCQLTDNDALQTSIDEALGLSARRVASFWMVLGETTDAEVRDTLAGIVRAPAREPSRIADTLRMMGFALLCRGSKPPGPDTWGLLQEISLPSSPYPESMRRRAMDLLQRSAMTGKDAIMESAFSTEADIGIRMQILARSLMQDGAALRRLPADAIDRLISDVTRESPNQIGSVVDYVRNAASYDSANWTLVERLATTNARAEARLAAAYALRHRSIQPEACAQQARILDLATRDENRSVRITAVDSLHELLCKSASQPFLDTSSLRYHWSTVARAAEAELGTSTTDAEKKALTDIRESALRNVR